MNIARHLPDTRRSVSLAVLAGLVAGLVYVAIQAEGFVSPEPDLHDAGVWVTRGDERRLGRTNTEIMTVDTSLSVESSAFDVLQSDDAVFVRQLQPSQIIGVEPAMAATVPGPELPPDAVIELGGGTAAMLDRGTGAVLIGSEHELLGFDIADEDQHAARFEDGAELAVGVDGTVHVLELATAEVHRFGADGAARDTVPLSVEGSGLERAQVTAVGETPVVVDTERSTVHVPDQAPIDVSDHGELAELQAPGAAAAGALLATDQTWLEAPLDGGDVTVLLDTGAGTPATPVVVAGCAYGAWGGNGLVARVCGDDPVDERQFPEFATGASLTWRVNRERVILNELDTGVHLVYGESDPVLLDEWAEALTDEPEETEEAEEDVPEVQQQERDRTKNEPPVANDTIAGTRRARPVVVHPLRNDFDPDGDVLIISPLEPLDPDIGRLTLVEDGQAILVELDADRTRPVSFPYEITDGFGHSDSATVTVNVVADDVNNPPEAAPDEETTVVAGGTVVHDVVAGAFDPEGDPISLQNATTDAGDIRFDADGQITFTATNEPGPVEVVYTLVDDRGAEGTGVLTVNVVAAEVNEPPVARNVHAETIVGREVVVDALANDTDANDDPISLVRVENLGRGTVRWDPASPEVRFVADQPGAYNLIYRITDGRDTAEALIRIDVVERGENEPPTAVRDDVRVRAGQPVYAEVLENDVDPDGDVLIVTGVSLPDPSPVDVEIRQRSVLKISTDRELDEVYEFDYHITDGTHEDTGRVVVAPTPPRDSTQPPVVGPDEFTVRAGGIAVLPVMDNDYDPDGGPLELVEPEEVDDETAAREGRLFLSDGDLRYEAPDEPRGTVVTSTTVVDEAENTASGQLLIEVIDATGERNEPPIAPTLEGRVLAGDRVTIPVPLATMDPEGDVVTLLGIDDAPSLGAVVEFGSSELVYEADSTSAGTDEFTYRVRDQFGLEATGTVLVGIVGTSTRNNDPVAVDDEVNVRPGTSVIVPALANDFDPDGDPVSYSEEEDDHPTPSVGTAEIRDGELHYEAPPDAPIGSSTSFTYAITDGRGGRDTATVTVSFVEEIPNRPPEPVDVIVEPQTPGTEFTTAPLQSNDVDPDGDELTVTSISRRDATLNDDGSVSMTMPDHPVQFTYVVSDGVDARRAAVIVPLDERRPPVTSLVTATVGIGESVTLDVLDGDVDPDGGDLVLLDVLGVRHGTAEIDGDQVAFTASEENYTGPAGFAYLVADSEDPSEALTAVGTAQITIEGDVNTPPEFADLHLEVPQGGERSVDLANAVTDPDDDQHTFGDLRGAGNGVDASLDGSSLAARASTDADPGMVASLTVTVSDGTDEVEGSIDVTVVSSDRPLPRALPVSARTVQGEPVTIDVLANDTNPFPEPLRIVEVTDPAGARVTTDGAVVEFAPDPNRRDLGDVTFEYTAEDATGDPMRHVTGTVTVTVVGRPNVPAAPTCIGGESGSVQIGWSAPSANGARIQEYRVRITEYPDGGSASTEVRTFPGGSTVQTIGGLTNGHEHTFEVAAINEAVGDEPEFSPTSPRCTPDQIPDRPAAPQVEFGDEELHLTFRAPPVDGSPVTSMTLRNTTTGETQDVGPNQTQYTWTGLENGTSYRFTLTATNDRGRSDPSELSTGDGIPAGVPRNAIAPTTEKGDRFLTVNWRRPEENGAAITEYRIRIIRAGVGQSPVTISDGSRRSAVIDTDNDVEYQFRLEARNKAGWSDPSPPSAPAISAGRPFPIDAVSATEGDRSSRLSFDEPNDNGASITRYEVSVNGGSWNALASDRIVRNLTNGTNYRFRVRAVNAEGRADPSQASNQINPYGNPTTPGNLRSSVSGRTITWSWNASDGNGRSIQAYQYRIDGGSWQSNGSSRQVQRNFGWNEGHRIDVRAVSTAEDSGRRRSGATSNSARTDYRTATDRVSDAFVGGTCAKPNRTHGSWETNRQECEARGGTWYSHGTAVTLNCRRAGNSYTVQYVDGPDQTWNLWVQVRSNGRWIRAAAMSGSGHNANTYPGLDPC